MVTIMVGLPGSGKSTWIEKNAKTDAVISTDEIRWKEFGIQYDLRLEPEVWQIAFSKLRGYLKQGRDIIFDATNITRQRRRLIKKIADQFKARTRVVVMNTSLEECLYRNERRTQDKVPAEIIKIMAYQFEWPEETEGFDEIQVVQPD
ncbi:ATP-binding protein [Calderihabitans maritimus]|nr:ATP-binding protein [Calderihabitans maritimus]